MVRKLPKRDDTKQLSNLVNERINLLEDMMKHSGPNIMCWIVDSNKISELKNKISNVETTQHIEFTERLRRIEKRLKDCYSYR